MKKKTLIISLGVIVVLLIALVVMVVYRNNHKISPMEEKYINKLLKDDYNDYAYIFDNEDSSDKDSKYIVYSVYRNYIEKEKKSLTYEEIVEYSKKYFKAENKVENIEKTGVSGLLYNHNIMNDIENASYGVELPKETYQTIALQKVYLYQVSNIKKNKNSYEVTYDKYEVKNPYEILNYYKDNNGDQEVIDAINVYLSGKMAKEELATYVDSKDISKFGTKKSSIKVTFELKDDKLLVK